MKVEFSLSAYVGPNDLGPDDFMNEIERLVYELSAEFKSTDEALECLKSKIKEYIGQHIETLEDKQLIYLRSIITAYDVEIEDWTDTDEESYDYFIAIHVPGYR